MDKIVKTLDLAEEDSQEFQIANVDHPAIEMHWEMFDNVLKFEAMPKGLVMGYAMIPNLEIPRLDKDGNVWYAKFTKETVQNCFDNFFQSRLTTNINDMHNTGEFIEGTFTAGGFIVDKEIGLVPPPQFPAVHGGWFHIVRVKNPEHQQDIINKLRNGFSVEGNFEVVDEEVKDESLIEAVRKIILNQK